MRLQNMCTFTKNEIWCFDYWITKFHPCVICIYSWNFSGIPLVNKNGYNVHAQKLKTQLFGLAHFTLDNHFQTILISSYQPKQCFHSRWSKPWLKIYPFSLIFDTLSKYITYIAHSKKKSVFSFFFFFFFWMSITTTQGRNRKIFLRGQSHFSWFFFPGWNAFSR